MKNNKVFIGIGLLLAIILGVAIVGGGAYYLGQKKTSPKPVEQNLKDLDTNAKAPDCLSTTAPWIRVLSPNGGETYTAGEKVVVKWTSCNITTDTEIYVIFGGLHFATKNTGSYTVSIPSNFPGGDYKAMVELDTPTPTTILDSSDDSFKINNFVAACFTSFPSLSLSLDPASPTENITAGSANIELARFGLTPSKNCDLKINRLTIVDGGPGLAHNLKIYNENNALIATGIADGYNQSSFYFSTPLVLSHSLIKTLIVRGDIQKDLSGITSTARRAVALNLAVGDWHGNVSGVTDQTSNISLNNYNIGTSAGQNLAQIHSNSLTVVQ